LRVIYAEGQKRLKQSAGSKAGNDGEYRLDNVAEGSYYLLATSPLASSKEGYIAVPTYYPSAIVASAAAAIRLGPGQMTRTDIRIHKARAFAVRRKLSGGEAGGLRG